MPFSWLLPALLAPTLVGQPPVKADLAAPTFTNSLGMTFARIPAGGFQMGGADASEGPAHKVNFAKPFFMGTLEVTQAQWKAVMETSPSKFPGSDRPVEYINWTEAKAFAARLNELEKGLNEYRLPSEAEWEYACRAGSTAAFSSGDDESRLGDAAWFDANAGGAPHPVGKKRANAWGLFDMHGNIWEWCEDTWHPNYQGAPADGSPWNAGGEAAKRVIRGGSWAFGASEARSGARMPYLAESRVGDSLGVRLVVVPKG